jgi:GT2 family glycosyltransferase
VAPAISAVVVCYQTPAEQVRAAIETLLEQSRPPLEIVVVDNDPAARLAPLLDAPGVRTVAAGRNLGYGGAVNLVAPALRGEYIVCLNPDATAAPDCLERLAAVVDADAEVAIAGAQVLLADGITRNAGANPLHPTGISPSGGYGEQREHGPPRDVAVVSGACALMRRGAFLELGGFTEELFLYYEDTDLCWRARIAGHRVLYCPEAVALHDYDFGGAGRKWLLLERNRLESVLTNYELRTLLVLAPLLLAAEAGLLAVAAAGGWLRWKLRAYAALRPGSVSRRRRAVQRTRRCADAELLAYFEDRLDSALLPRGAGLANLVCVPYLALVRRLLGVPPAIVTAPPARSH